MLWWTLLGPFLLKFLSWLQNVQEGKKISASERAKAADLLHKMQQCNITANMCGISPKEMK